MAAAPWKNNVPICVLFFFYRENSTGKDFDEFHFFEGEGKIKRDGKSKRTSTAGLRCSKNGPTLPIELALFSELWLGPKIGLGPIEVFPKAPFSKGSAI